MKQKFIIAVIDGQGGGIGKQLIERLVPVCAAKGNIIIRALGTNALATNAMLKAGASDGATGENAIIVNSRKADVITGVMPIIMPDSILGEVTPAMAEAIGGSEAVKVLIPLQRCNTLLAIPSSWTLNESLAAAVDLICSRLP